MTVGEYRESRTKQVYGRQIWSAINRGDRPSSLYEPEVFDEDHIPKMIDVSILDEIRGWDRLGHSSSGYGEPKPSPEITAPITKVKPRHQHDRECNMCGTVAKNHRVVVVKHRFFYYCKHCYREVEKYLGENHE